MKALIDTLLENAKSQDNNIQADARLTLWFLLEYNRGDIHNEERKRYYSNYIPAVCIGQRLVPELEAYIVKEIIHIVRNIDKYCTGGFFIIIGWASQLIAVEALLTLMQGFPEQYDPRVARQAINCLMNNIWYDDNEKPIPEIITQLKLNNPHAFLNRVIAHRQDQEAVTWAKYASSEIKKYLSDDNAV